MEAQVQFQGGPCGIYGKVVLSRFPSEHFSSSLPTIIPAILQIHPSSWSGNTETHGPQCLVSLHLCNQKNYDIHRKLHMHIGKPYWPVINKKYGESGADNSRPLALGCGTLEKKIDNPYHMYRTDLVASSWCRGGTNKLIKGEAFCIHHQEYSINLKMSYVTEAMNALPRE